AGGNTRVVTLWLQSGGRATLETVDLGKERTPAENGIWSAQGEEVTVALQGASEPLVFGIQQDQLVPKRWDHHVYGDSGLLLTPRARGRGRAGGGRAGRGRRGRRGCWPGRLLLAPAPRFAALLPPDPPAREGARAPRGALFGLDGRERHTPRRRIRLHQPGAI